MKKLQVIKIGGKVIDDDEQLLQVLNAFAHIEGPKILVHGGGSKASEMEKALGLVPNMVEGRRITNKDSLDVVTMVYAGLINKTIIAGLQQIGCNAIGLSGADGNAVEAQKRPINTLDYGFVGDVKKVNDAFIDSLLGKGMTPVFSAITHNGDGQLLNTNADTMAAEIAIAISDKYQVELVLVFEKNGVLGTNGEVIEQIEEASFLKLKEDKTISDGMIPKLINAFNALKKGVVAVKLTSANYLIDNDSECTKVVL